MSAGEVTALLAAASGGDRDAADALMPVVYDELHRLAHRSLRKEPNADLLQTTVLVHEAYLKLVGEDIDWQGRDHFFAVASTAMRRVVVDHARRRFAQKRGGGQKAVSLDDV